MKKQLNFLILSNNKKFMKKVLILTTILALIAFSSCNDDKKNNLNNNNTDTNQNYFPELIKVKDKLFNVPSPIQASFLIEKNKIQFNPEFLNKTANYSRYLTTFKQSLNVGVYGSNLATLFVYDQLSQSAQYLSVVKKLSEQLGIFNSINQTLFDRIERNSQKKDSLLFLISDVYKEIDNYLTENDQQEIGVLILVGGWIESLYLLTQIVTISPTEEVKERIAQQKVPITNILELYMPYKDKSKEYDTLYKSLELLNVEFQKVEENYIYSPAQTYPDKQLTVVNSSTTYNITDQNIKDIKNQVEKIRNWIVK